MSYDPYDNEPRSYFGLVAFVSILVICGVLAIFLLKSKSTLEGEEKAVVESEPVKEKEEEPEPTPVSLELKETVEEPPESIFETLGMGVAAYDPAKLVDQIGRNLEAGDVIAAANIIGRTALSQAQLDQLHRLHQAAQLKLNMERPVTEIGELELNRRARWALNLEWEGARIYLDLIRKDTKEWQVQKVTLPEVAKEGEIPRAVLVDALGITDAFLQAALRQSFETAKSFVRTGEVSDAKIAGLCIVFEEGQYRLRPKKPLRALFNRGNVAAFVANVETSDGKTAEFGVSVERKDENSPWQVNEINLDSLLADYASRVAGGDVYYTPLVRNPTGGDTLILYFGFDEKTLTARTERQLEIVALLLQTDTERELTLSGHTDAIGSDAYNEGLSGRRAEAVREFLVESGVDPKQIKTVAHGKTQPRRPNKTKTGEDNPDGRRANRRTEIYLDF